MSSNQVQWLQVLATPPTPPTPVKPDISFWSIGVSNLSQHVYVTVVQ